MSGALVIELSDLLQACGWADISLDISSSEMCIHVHNEAGTEITFTSGRKHHMDVVQKGVFVARTIYTDRDLALRGLAETLIPREHLYEMLKALAPLPGRGRGRGVSFFSYRVRRSLGRSC